MKNRGLLLKPDTLWDGSAKFEFVIAGRSDSDYAKDVDTHRSVAGWAVTLCGSPVSTKSKMLAAVSPNNEGMGTQQLKLNHWKLA
jgi:hypothetical protein